MQSHLAPLGKPNRTPERRRDPSRSGCVGVRESQAMVQERSAQDTKRPPGGNAAQHRPIAARWPDCSALRAEEPFVSGPVSPSALARTLPERVEPHAVVVNQRLRMFDLFLRHLADHVLLGDRRIRVAADRRKHVPHIGAGQVRRSQSAPDLEVPANSGLRPGVTLHCRPQIPLESPHIVLFDTETGGIHDADQFLCLGIARLRRLKQFHHRRRIVARIHHVARSFDLGTGRKGKNTAQGKGKAQHGVSCLLAALLALAVCPAHASELRHQLQAEDFHDFDSAKAQIGQLLFWDPILSGNRNISCATCHHPDHGTSDGLALGIGEGGSGVGADRTGGTGETRIRKRIPRNAPGLWNLGAREFDAMFHDGRVSVSDLYGNGFSTPAQEWLPDGLDGLLAAQALFPLTSQFEMAGNPRENEVAGAVHDRIDAVWPILAKRVRVIPEYAEMFIAAFDDVRDPMDITITHIANSLAAFEGLEWQSFDSPFDKFLSGDPTALTIEQNEGLDLFYGKAGCSTCHSGPLLTDHAFYALALPHFGPGRTRIWDPVVRDVGHIAVTDRLEDAYRFRTPSLRNVSLTAPYGHNGAYATLDGIVRHHLDPGKGFATWRPEAVALPDVPWLASADFLPLEDNRERNRLASSVDIAPVALDDQEVARIVAFVHALTGAGSTKGRLGRPEAVPSGLEVEQ
jgi:cytochrome c peroxidase